MKTAKTENKQVEPKLWCESCHIRIAESEQRTTVDGKTYHPNCYGKLSRQAKSDGMSNQSAPQSVIGPATT